MDKTDKMNGDNYDLNKIDVFLTKYHIEGFFSPQDFDKIFNLCQVVVHTFNPSTWGVERQISVSLRPAWSTK